VYRFRLTATGDGGVGHAEIGVVINTPPVAGACTVEPPSGVAVTTTFALACSDWTDVTGDLPLR
jgi:hypothetical protein